MKIEKPIFIIGSGRSGTTLLYNLLATHPQLCWFSNLTNKYPSIHSLALLHRALDLPLIGDRMKNQITHRTRRSIRPSEANRIYHIYCGFNNIQRMTEDDLTPQMAQACKRIIRSHLKFTDKERFLAKQTTNNQRIRLIDRLFPDARFVHIIRDGRAVASSLYRVRWWDEIGIWWLGGKPKKWEEMGREPIELCALHWKKDVEEILQNKHLFGDRYLEIRYEALVEDVEGTIAAILRFCELEPFPELHKYIPANLKNMNYKWKEYLTEPQKTAVQESVGEFLTQLGYGT